MALLDNLPFNPLLYGGQNGNILDMLQSFQQANDAYKPGAGFSLGGPPAPQDNSVLPQSSEPTSGQNTIPVGDYQMPRIGFGSPMDANAQMPAPQAAPQPQPSAAPVSSEPGFGDHLIAGLQGFANSGGLIPAVVNGITGLATGQRTDPTGIALQGRNMTARALLAKGVDPQTVQAAVANPELMKQLIAANFGNTSLTTDQRNFSAASKDPRFAAFLKDNKEGSEKFGLSPMYGVDASGNPVAIQLSSKGGSQPVQLPDGVTISKSPIKLDTGTEIEFLDPITRQVVRRVPKDLKGEASQKALGKAQGAAQATLPTDIQNADQTIKQIDDLIKNPGLDSIVGPLDQFRGSVTLGNEGRDALARFNQLKGKAFLQAYTTLKGGGQITEVEGQKAQDAMARMDRAQSEQDFRTALTDFRDAVKTGVQKLKEKAGVGAPQGTTSTGLSWSIE